MTTLKLAGSFLSLTRMAARLLLWLLLFVGSLSSSFAAEPERASSNSEMENRFLFILETSSAMKDRAKLAREAILSLLRSGIDGQMRKGDTFGIWTYNDKLDPEFPMQVWSEEDKDGIIANTGAFLGKRKYSKKAQLERVLPLMFQIIQDSRTITVILISDGTGIIKGTPFDIDINDLHKKYGPDFRRAKLPFVTVLAARNGTVFDYTVDSANGKIRVPKTIEPPKPKTNSVVVAKTNATPRPTLPPVIFIKPPTNNIVMPAPSNPAPVAASVKLAQTNVGAVVNGGLRVTEDRSTNVALTAVSNLVSAFASAPLTSPIISSPASNQNSSTRISTAKGFQNSVQTSGSAGIAITKAALAPVNSDTAPATQASVKTNSDEFRGAPEIRKTGTEPVEHNKSTPNPVIEHSSPKASAKADLTPKSHLIASSETPAAPGRMRLLLLIASGFLVAAAAVILYMVLRMRSGKQPSLISQSITRNRH